MSKSGKKINQIGCGYCIYEKVCLDRKEAIKQHQSTRDKAINCKKFKLFSHE